jgi:lipoyl(octanoyl) transferase
MKALLYYFSITLSSCSLVVSWILQARQARGFTGAMAVSQQQLGQFEPLEIHSTDDRIVFLHDFSDYPPIEFQKAWDLQQEYLQDHLSGNCTDRLIFLQHEPVYTLGTASDESLILDNSVRVIRINRGGEVTCHCPGQLTIYPVIDLRKYRQDIHWYVRALEQVVLEALEICFEHHGRRDNVRPLRDDSFTGVFAPGFGKVAAVGVNCRRWITQHGVAVNVEKESLEFFSGIVPCGLTGDHGVVTCVNDLVDKPVSVAQMACYVKEAFELVFCAQLKDED